MRSQRSARFIAANMRSVRQSSSEVELEPPLVSIAEVDRWPKRWRNTPPSPLWEKVARRAAPRRMSICDCRQGAIGLQRRFWLMSVLARTISFRMTATRTTLAGLPAWRSVLGEGCEVGVVRAGGERRHVEGVSDARTPTLDGAVTDAFAALASDRCDAGEHGRLLAGAGAELGEVGDQDGGGDRSDAWDRGQDGIAAGKRRFGLDPLFDLGIKPFDMAFEGGRADEPFRLAGRLFAPRRADWSTPCAPQSQQCGR